MNAVTQLHPGTDTTAPTGNLIRSALYALTRTDGSVAMTVLRIALAVVIFPHGAQKFLGWFGGYGFAGTMGFFTQNMGIPAILAFGVIMIEFLGPILLVAGVATRLTALSIGIVMGTAMFMAHVQHGFFMNWYGKQAGEGIEYFVLVLGISLALMIAGGGRWSVDRAVTTPRRSC